MKFVYVFFGVLTCAVIGGILGEGLLQVLAFLCSVIIGGLLCSVACGVFQWPMVIMVLISGLFVGQAIGSGMASLGLVIGGVVLGVVVIMVIGYVYDREEGGEDEDYLHQIEN